MDEVNSCQLETPETVALALAERCRRLRLARRLKQSTLTDRVGEGSLGSLHRFEQTGEVSLRSLLRLAFAIVRLGDWKRFAAVAGISTRKAREIAQVLHD